MKIIMTSILLVLPAISQNLLFAQDDCLSADERFAQFRADNSLHKLGTQPALNAPSRSVGAEDCLLKIRGRDQQAVHPGGPVSRYRLQHKISSKAKREFENGVKMTRAEDLVKAEAHFRKAIEADPGYMEAHNNLGSNLISQNRWEEALEELQTAASLDPSSSYVHANLGVIYLQFKQYGKAEDEGRIAVALDPLGEKPNQVLRFARMLSGKANVPAGSARN